MHTLFKLFLSTLLPLLVFLANISPSSLTVPEIELLNFGSWGRMLPFFGQVEDTYSKGATVRRM